MKIATTNDKILYLISGLIKIVIKYFVNKTNVCHIINKQKKKKIQKAQK